MSVAAVIVFLIEVGSLVVGQVVLKHAVDRGNEMGFQNSHVVTLFVVGVAALTISFFLTLALLQHFALSYFFPFQASSTIFIVAAAAIFLRERLSFQLLAGTLLIFAGIILVSAS